MVDGAPVRELTTPGAVQIEKGYAQVVLRFSHPGYQTIDVPLERRWSGGFKADILLLSPLAVIIDLADGAAWNYPDTLKVMLERSERTSERVAVVEFTDAGTASRRQLRVPMPRDVD